MSVKKILLVLSSIIVLGQLSVCASPNHSDPALSNDQIQTFAPNDGVDFQDLAGMSPDTKHQEAEWHYALANFYIHNFNWKLASLELQDAIMYEPNFRSAHQRLCFVSLLNGEFGRALAELLEVVGIGEPVPLNLSQRMQLREKIMVAHYNLGIEYGKQYDWKKAIAEFGWAMNYAPDAADIHSSLAFAYANLGDFDLAEKQYTTSFALAPNDAYNHADLAEVLDLRGQKQRALSQMSQAVKLAPTAAALHVDLGWMAESRGDLDTAAKEFQTAVNLSSGHAGLWTHLGKILERQGKLKEATDAYNQALATDPNCEAKDLLSKLKTTKRS